MHHRPRSWLNLAGDEGHEIARGTGPLDNAGEAQFASKLRCARPDRENGELQRCVPGRAAR